MGWILHSPRKVKTGYASRAGLFRPAVWPFLYKAYSVGDFAEFLETYGLPIIVGKFPPGASGEEKASLFRAVKALGHDARGIMPEGMQLEIKEIISADITKIAINGAQPAATALDQGAGNLGNFPLYIGRRGGANLPLNGRLYGLIIRGAATPNPTISCVERDLNAKSRAY